MILYILTYLLPDEVRPLVCRRRKGLSTSGVRDESIITGAEPVWNCLAIWTVTESFMSSADC